MKVTPQEAIDNDNKLRARYGDILCGVDEVGRGSWAGPLVVGAVAMPKGVFIPKLTDSKQIKSELRYELAERIKEHAIAWAVYEVEPRIIDRRGLTWANANASYEAAMAVKSKVGHIDLFVLDQMPDCNLQPSVMMSKADALSQAVAAASIIAKTYRDSLMCELDNEYPDYKFSMHKGYISPEHKEAVRLFGRVRGLHRFSYKVGSTDPDMGRTDLLARKLAVNS